VGFRTTDGKFLLMARSNVAETPRAWPSVKAEERYMHVEAVRKQAKTVPPPIQQEARLSRITREFSSAKEQRIPSNEPGGPPPQISGPLPSEKAARTLVEIYYQRLQERLGLSPQASLTRGNPAQPKGAGSSDLTEMSERIFISGISS